MTSHNSRRAAFVLVAALAFGTGILVATQFGVGDAEAISPASRRYIVVKVAAKATNLAEAVGRLDDMLNGKTSVKAYERKDGEFRQYDVKLDNWTPLNPVVHHSSDHVWVTSGDGTTPPRFDTSFLILRRSD